MNTSFERSKQTTDEWYTPKWIVDALGSFDLDPCAPENRLWNTAKRHITPSEDGLKTEWRPQGESDHQHDCVGRAEAAARRNMG